MNINNYSILQSGTLPDHQIKGLKFTLIKKLSVLSSTPLIALINVDAEGYL